MVTSATHRLAKVLLRVVVVYALLLAGWVMAAPWYHGLLARMAGAVVPLVADARVDRIWLEDRRDEGDGVGACFRITFHGRDASYGLTETQRVRATMDTVVDIRQFGYPILTFLALSLGVTPPRRLADAGPVLIGASIVFTIYSLWVAVDVFQYLAVQELEFLRNNAVARAIPPDLYRSARVPMLVYLGQLIPVAVYAGLSGRRFLQKVAPPRTTRRLTAV
ncbi:MAG: hypothetical protein Kow0074_17430 [Candidatus Zixiibacteriota bacterium]